MQEIESKIKESENNTKNYIGWIVLVVDLWFAQIYDINIKFPNIFLEKFKKIKNSGNLILNGKELDKQRDLHDGFFIDLVVEDELLYQYRRF